MEEPSLRNNEIRRVVVMVDSFPTTSETFVLDQIDALRARGLDVRIVAGYRNKGGLIQESGKRLASEAFYAEDHLPATKLLPLIIRRRLFPVRLLNRIYEPVLRDADVILCHFGPVGLRAAAILRGPEAARLWTIFHGYDLSSFIKTHGRRVYGTLFARGDRFLAVSRLWMARLEELGCPADRIALLRMGIDVHRIPFVERKASGQMRILSVCRLVEKKGIQYALEALAQLSRSRPTVDWSYEIIGEGPLLRSLERLSRKLEIDSRVKFLGKLSAVAVRGRLEASDIFMLPSVTARNGDMEGIPVSIMEAMASGTPVLSTLHSGIPELVEHGVSGLLAPERDAAALASNLCLLIDRSELRQSMAMAARAKVEREFNQDKIADAFAAYISNAPKRRQPAFS